MGGIAGCVAPVDICVKPRSTHDECRRHGVAKLRVEALAAASDGTLGREWVSTSPEGQPRQASIY